MSSFLPETFLKGTLVLIGDVPLRFIFTISLFALILYSSGLKSSKNKNGFLSRLKEFIRSGTLVNKYPGTNYYPFLGSTPEIFHLVFQPCRAHNYYFFPNCPQDFFPWIKKMTESRGPIFRFWLFNQPKLMISCPETAIASLQEENFPGRASEAIKAAQEGRAVGLIVIDPELHSSRKKMWKQWFTRRIINGNLETFQKEAIRLSDELSKEIDKPFDFVDYSLCCTFRIIASSAFGEDYVNSIPEADAKQHFHGFTTFCINLFTRAFRPWLASNFVYYNFTSDGRTTMKCVNTAHKLTYTAIKHGKNLRENKMGRMDSNNNTPCFLDHLLDIYEQGDLTEYEVFQELNNFLLAGYDTTGLTLCWTLYLLSLNPECQTKIVNELEEIFSGNLKDISSEVTPKHLQNMRYLELCIKESLRMYPSLGLLFRRSANDKEVVMPDGKIIPSGVDMYIPLRIVHKNPKYFPEPEKFIPKRHLVPIPANIPFGLGSRNCIGQVYAMQELKMILAYLLMEYKWETLEEPGLEPLMTPMSYPENGLRFKISKR